MKCLVLSRSVHGALHKKADRAKRQQTCASLKFPASTGDTWGVMPFSTSHTNPRNEHQLVFTSSQAARYLGVSLATVRRWTDAGHIGCYRTPGGQRRFSRDQLDDFIASMQHEGPVAHEQAATQSSIRVA